MNLLIKITFLMLGLIATHAYGQLVPGKLSDYGSYRPMPTYSGSSSSSIGMSFKGSEINEILNIETSENSAINTVSVKTQPRSRGVKEIAVFDQVAPGTVLILNEKGMGSGVLLTDKGHIVTNQHVVGDAKAVSVFFKPPGDGTKLSKKDAVRGEVIKTDMGKDLALVKVSFVPSFARPVALADGNPKVGADMHAIGHPVGEFWSYTKGYVSAVRDQYEWKEGADSILRKAKVIQTQTPINPGNSGGPLVDDNRKLVGINSFGDIKHSGMNFAVSSDDVKSFLQQETLKSSLTKKSSAESKKNCGDNPMGSGRDKNKDDGEYSYIAWDSKCTGKADALVVTPDQKSKPIILLVDTNADGKWDIIIYDIDRDGKWDKSFHDSNYDGAYDLVGFHPDGKLIASRFEPYKVN